MRATKWPSTQRLRRPSFPQLAARQAFAASLGNLWMKGEPDTAAALMRPANEDALVSRPVSKAVGNVKNNGLELLETI
jgi:putative SOS response-associated peptidase YedK